MTSQMWPNQLMCKYKLFFIQNIGYVKTKFHSKDDIFVYGKRDVIVAWQGRHYIIMTKATLYICTIGCPKTCLNKIV